LRILVTGAAGSIGSALVSRLRRLGFDVCATDIHNLDVTDSGQVRAGFHLAEPDLIYHLAGAKHAPEGESDPAHVAMVNVAGTENVLAHARGVKVVLASTCKACDPETAYGASKLIAERMVLNYGGVVVRYHNVRETSGNVFRLWEQLPDNAPVPWTDCWRYFIGIDEALSLTVAARSFPSGRYAVRPGLAQHMHTVASSVYPGRDLVEMPARRGDRYREPLVAACESYAAFSPGVLKITGQHDPA
jgi:FlaA1/EpsC-like NDP-sugar epimerase